MIPNGVLIWNGALARGPCALPLWATDAPATRIVPANDTTAKLNSRMMPRMFPNGRQTRRWRGEPLVQKNHIVQSLSGLKTRPRALNVAAKTPARRALHPRPNPGLFENSYELWLFGTSHS